MTVEKLPGSQVESSSIDSLSLEKPAPVPLIPAASPSMRAEVEAYMNARWREINIPAWRRILRESILSDDREREAYARDMLKNMLRDPEYGEGETL